MILKFEQELVDAFFSTVSGEMHVLEPIFNEAREIIDFKYLDGSPGAYGNGVPINGKSLLTVHPWKRKLGLFDQFIKVIHEGASIDTVIQVDEYPRKWFRVKARKFRDGILLFREDVTNNKQTEEKIMQLNQVLFSKNRELESLSSELKTFNNIAAHDYNETLRNMYKNLEFIVKNDAKNLSDAGKANIRRAQSAIQKMKLMTEDIIAFSRVNSEQEMSNVDLNNVLSVVLIGLDEKIKAENAVVHIGQLPVVQGYPSLLSLLFQHLVNNSLKFRKAEIDPVIHISYKIEAGSAVQHSAAIRELNYHCISVIDNGIGFDPEEGEKIFTMFYRLREQKKHKGSGIGLAICKKIMDLHGGFIASECTPECTTFKCYFPTRNKE